MVLAVIDEKGYLLELIDKEEDSNLSHHALAGYYCFLDGAMMKSAVQQSLSENERELSAAIRRYMRHYPICAYQANEWYDFGHIDNLLDSKRKLLRPRYFNQLFINPVLNTITKISEDSQKLINELDWYLNLPDDLKVLTPRILHREKKNNHIEVVQEYYGYPTLAELYVYSDLQPENWRIILRHLLKLHQELRKHTANLPVDVLREMYIQKTDERLLALTQRSEFWHNTLNRAEIIYNGKIYQNYPVLKPFIERMIKDMEQSFTPTIMHGDFCFSNILYDPSNQIVRLIDPRGSFGTVKGIYGDPRYDMAKLRHSIAGMYDFIVADMFEIETDRETFSGEVFDMQNLLQIIENFDKQLEEANYNLMHIKLIEGLLFISMLPLHQDYPQRQMMMFLTGIVRLNEVKAEYDALIPKSKSILTV